jgi:hypothetical protein
MATLCQPWLHKSRIVSSSHFLSVSSAVIGDCCVRTWEQAAGVSTAIFAGGWAVIARNQFLFFQITAAVHLCVTFAKCFVFAEGQIALV